MTGPSITLPPLEELLVHGGDARILLDAQGRNKYGCTPIPDIGLQALGSSTASVISRAAYDHVTQVHARIQQQARKETLSQIYSHEMETMRGELLQLFGLEASRTDILFAASGTDIHLIAAQLVAHGLTTPAGTLAITVDAAETGSGVPAALAGKHFSSCTALGDQVEQLSQVTGCAKLEVANISLRKTDGDPRDMVEVDAEATRLVENAVAQGQQVLLMLVDVSKTGLIAPSPACVVALQRQFAGQVQVMVDACQFRIATSTLRAYLDLGFMVAVTGSKFVTGPTFSGALIFNKGSLASDTHGLSRYSVRADWPRHLQHAVKLENSANIGLLLRWQAALYELRSFLAVPQAEIARLLQRFANDAEKNLNGHACFDALPTPVLNRMPTVAGETWDNIPTIFPFLLRSRNGKYLNREQTTRIYQSLQVDMAHQYHHPLAAVRGQLGQPVMCGERAGEPVSALRICASARMVVDAYRGDGGAVIVSAMSVLDKTLLLMEKM